MQYSLTPGTAIFLISLAITAAFNAKYVKDEVHRLGGCRPSGCPLCHASPGWVQPTGCQHVVLRLPCGRLAFPARLLVGLRRYQVAGSLAPSQRQRGRRVKSKKDDDGDAGTGLGDAEALVAVPTTYRDAFDSQYFNLLDGLVSWGLCILVMSNRSRVEPAFASHRAWRMGSGRHPTGTERTYFF